MPDWLLQAASRLSSDPFLQGLLAALATFVLEDPATIGCGLLVADGRMAFLTALIGLSVGITVGDVGLYLIGRGSGSRVSSWVSEARMRRAESWFHRNLVTAVVLSRFVPGMRLPTYLAAGVLRAPLGRFVAVAVLASLGWTSLLLWGTSALGEAFRPLIGRYRWPLAVLILLVVLLMQRLAARRMERGGAAADGVPVSRFEFWPPWLFYVPVAFQYAWLALRHRGLMLPTVANPRIYSGGLIGESKSEILDQVPDGQRRWIASYVVLERPADDAFARARAAMDGAGLAYPVVAKPDVGQRGAGVRPIRDDEELRGYLERFPVGRQLMLQRLAGPSIGTGPSTRSAPAGLDDVSEAGVMYWRMPGQERGAIFSITLKRSPSVVGDGRTTLRKLIETDPRARRIRHVYLRRHRSELDRVPADGETFPLVFAGNHCQGAVFLDGTDLLTPQLLERVHGIAASMPEFWFGRFDIRFRDLQAFLGGEDLQIIEINGAGAEATHIWDGSARLRDAYSTLFRQFRILFEIGAANRRRGYRPLGVGRFLEDVVAYRRLARSYPLTG